MPHDNLLLHHLCFSYLIVYTSLLLHLFVPECCFSDVICVVNGIPMVCSLIRHISSIDDPYLLTKWNKCKRDLSEEFNIVRQIDAERQAFKEAPGAQPRPSSPRIMRQSHFPVDEVYLPSSTAPAYPSVIKIDSDDPDVWRPPNRDAPMQYGSRRPTKAGQMAAAAQAKRMAAYARGAGDRGVGSGGAVGKVSKPVVSGPVTKGAGAAASVGGTSKGTSSIGGGQAPRKSNARSTPTKRDSLVRVFLSLQVLLSLA